MGCIKGVVAVIGLALATGSFAKQTSFQAPTPATEKNLPGPARHLHERLVAAAALLDAGEHARAEEELSEIIDAPAFDDLTRATRRSTYSFATIAAMNQERYERARELARHAVEIDPSDPDDWFRLSILETELDNPDESAAHLATVARGWPHLLVNIRSGYIHQTASRSAYGSRGRLELLQALYEADWPDDDQDAGNLWHALALEHLQRGDSEAAAEAIARISGPEELVMLRVDRRFDAFVDRDAPRFDIARAAQQRVASLRAKAEESPRSLHVLMELSYALLATGAEQEVLSLTDAALAAIAGAPDDEPPYDDMDQQIWIMNNRAIALRRQGNIDAALAQMQQASRLREQGQLNVSQALNLGHFHASLGQPEQALAAISEVGEMSGYGRMVQASIQLAAAVQREDEAATSKALAHIRAHRDDSPRLLLEALLLTNQLDEAARELIDQLESPDKRAEALFWAQQMRTVPPLPGDVRSRARRAMLLARDDVRHAIERVGRIERHPVFARAGMD